MTEKARQEWYLATNEVNKLKQELMLQQVELANERAELARKLAEPPPKAKIIEVPVEVIVEAPTEIIVPITDWDSVSSLKAFLESDNTSEVVRLTANGDGTIRLNGQCEERALQLINGAQAEGKRLFFVPLHPAEYLKWHGKEIEEGHYHAICGALVGNNEFWYIEPSNDKCWLAQYLD